MFNLVREDKYIVDKEFIGLIEMTIGRVIKELSKDVTNFNIAMDDEIFMHMLSRYVSSKFIEKLGDKIKDEDYITIDIFIKNNSYMVTIGNINKEYVYGIQTI